MGHCVLDESKRPPKAKILTENELVEKGLTFPDDYPPSYKMQVIMEVSAKPDMSKEEFKKKMEDVKKLFQNSIKQNCPEEEKILQTIEDLNNGQWPENTNNIPWDSIKPWPNRNELVNCASITQLYNTFKKKINHNMEKL